ncbi:MAG: hypothetical protein IPH44_09380 [Myxococcales bacterium]|nr:hypothetical protein [Myxococcales bacterium]MBK7198759.1 hypothetical protein [Myxococcales bacterium]MBP6845361.1 hypothetical protein [Kofleriaceae bacterium]
MRPIWFALAAVPLLIACADDDAIDSDEEARRAYLGLDGSVAKSLALGFAGFNAATSANIPPQMTTGDAAGTLAITGQVDQGASANKEMRLYVGMVDYDDGPFPINDAGDTISIHYDTDAATATQPYLHLSLRGIPSGTFTGELTGTYHLTGAIEGDATLDLTMSGALMDDGSGGTLRMPGATTVTGTATSGDGLYQVTLTL